MFRQSSLILILVLGLVGCASDGTAPGVPDDHPASFATEVASLHASSATLAIIEPVGVTPTRSMQMDHSHGEANPSPDAPVYVCPMHPEVTSSNPAAHCPKCGMKLKARQIEEATK